MRNNLVFEENPFFLNDENITIKEDQVFVILPFKHTIIFEKIVKPILANLELRCIKADDIFKTGALMQVIANSIRESAIIIADLTDRNANVFYELGLAHAFKKRVILLTQNDDDVPSDLKANKYYKYDVATTDGIANFEEVLRKLKEGIDLSLIFEHRDKIYDISSEHGNEEQISSKFLQQQEGAISIWAFLDDFHITATTSETHWNYLISHATNSGNAKKVTYKTDVDNNGEEKEANVYPNYWAIARLANSNGVFWRFACNSDSVSKTDIRSDIKLVKGWHLFSIIWSNDKNYIKFYVDDKLGGQAEFRFWPTDFDKHVFIGTWPTRAKEFYFNSKIGNWKIYKNAISFEKMKTFYINDKPKKKK